jgi:hypothetical protein
MLSAEAGDRPFALVHSEEPLPAYTVLSSLKQTLTQEKTMILSNEQSKHTLENRCQQCKWGEQSPQLKQL